jgi:hypothetical protein
MAYAPKLDAQFPDAVQVCNDIHAVRCGSGMVFLGYPNDRFHHIWEAAATAPALLHRMIDLGRNDKLPRILVEQRHDRLLYLFLGKYVALTDQHFRLYG